MTQAADRGDDAATTDALTRQYGRDLFTRLETDRPVLFSPRWWDERVMAWSMDDEQLKVQLFRFIDALPTLQTPEQITRHLKEYLGEAPNGRSPSESANHHGLRLLLPPIVRMLAQFPGGVGRLVADMARTNARRMARRFIAGSNVAEALAAISRLRQQQMGFTIDLLGEAVLTEPEARQYQRSYLELVDGLTREVNKWPSVDQIDRDAAGPLPRVNISIKLSSLFSQFDPIDPRGTAAAVRERLEPILYLARDRGAFINIDMEQHAYKDVTLRIFQEVFGAPEFRDWPHVGIAIQAYLRSCGEDLAQLAHWAAERGTPIWVRLVKGAYWDYEMAIAAQNDWPRPVFARKWETDANFEAQTRFLIKHHHLLRPAIGSHNIRSIAHALALADQHRLPPRTIEFQLLYGMADPIKAALVSTGQRVRVYTPYGQLLPGMAYLVRRLLENTANQSFLRAGFVEHVPEEQLLMNPLHSAAASAPRREMPPGGAANGEKPFRNEPVTDFSRETNQRKMRDALSSVGRQLGVVCPLVIDGKVITTARLLDSLNPSHKQQLVGRCGRAEVAHAEQAVAAAARAFPAWRVTSAEERAARLRTAAQHLRERRFELAAWEVYECAKQWREADADVAEAIDFCEYYAREMLRLAKPQHRDVPGEENEYFYEPRGVVVVIAPWNFPLAILCGMTAAALVTGNTAIMKPAEQSPIIAAKLMEIWLQAGIPPGVVHYLPGVGEEIGPTLVSHKDVAAIAFTGSRPVGLHLNQEAAATPPGQDHVKRVVVEMGGKNAIIVDEDADLDEAVHGVVMSAFGYQGQKCSACSRVVVLEPIYETFLNRLVDAVRSLRTGPAEEPGNAVGPVIDADAQQRVLSYIQKGKAESRLAYAADVGALAGEGYYVGPHVFAEVSPTATIAQEEIFGPVLAVIKARDLTHALEIANGTVYALTGGLFSRSPANLARVRREFRVGNLYINRKITGALVDRQPFGGFKLSGIGSKAGGPDYLLQFVNPRTITENTMRHGFAPGSLDVAEAGV